MAPHVPHGVPREAQERPHQQLVEDGQLRFLGPAARGPLHGICSFSKGNVHDFKECFGKCHDFDALPCVCVFLRTSLPFCHAVRVPVLCLGYEGRFHDSNANFEVTFKIMNLYIEQLKRLIHERIAASKILR